MKTKEESKDRKKIIKKAVKKAFKEYGEVFKALGEESFPYTKEMKRCNCEYPDLTGGINPECPKHGQLTKDLFKKYSTTDSWEEDFDNYFQDVSVAADIRKGMYDICRKKDVKQFIKSLLHQQRIEIKERIKKIGKDHGEWCSKDHNIHTVLDDILKEIGKEE